MRRREAALVLLVAAFVLLGLLTVFALELADTQAKSRSDIEQRVHERAVLAGSLIDSLLGTASQQTPQYSSLYGGRTVSVKTLNAKRQQNLYLAVLDAQDHVLASSHGFTAQARSDLAQSAALALIRQGRPYALGNVLPYGRTGVINFAVTFPTPNGPRILLSGFSPSALASFVTTDLREIPGPVGSHNYLIDGNRRVVASTNPARPPGYVFNKPAEAVALSHPSGDRVGHYYDQVPLRNSSLRIILAEPDGPLFASISGLHKLVPWAIFAAFALVAVVALVLGRRWLRAALEVREAHDRLEAVNAELASTNGELQARARELARSNAELEQFASIASHDLQEPLRKVRTFTQQLTVSDADRLSEKGRDYVHRANSAAERMQRLIEDLLKFSRVATHGHEFTRVSLSEVVAEVLEDLEAQIDQVDAHIEVGDLPEIEADRMQMHQLMQNLISNAIKFHRPGEVPEVTVDSALKDGELHIRVRDNGIGFEPQYGEKIFRVFERLHGRTEYPGTGIGLALCMRIAERHGGNICAASEPGVGSTFIVKLPLSRLRSTAPAEERPAATHGQAHVPV